MNLAIGFGLWSAGTYRRYLRALVGMFGLLAVIGVAALFASEFDSRSQSGVGGSAAVETGVAGSFGASGSAGCGWREGAPWRDGRRVSRWISRATRFTGRSNRSRTIGWWCGREHGAGRRESFWICKAHGRAGQRRDAQCGTRLDE